VAARHSLIPLVCAVALAFACSSGNNNPPPADAVKTSASTVIDEGRQTFRFETFGDEGFWGDTIKLHQAIEGSAHGGVGAGVNPQTALAVGLCMLSRTYSTT